MFESPIEWVNRDCGKDSINAMHWKMYVEFILNAKRSSRLRQRTKENGWCLQYLFDLRFEFWFYPNRRKSRQVKSFGGRCTLCAQIHTNTIAKPNIRYPASKNSSTVAKSEIWCANRWTCRWSVKHYQNADF